MKNWQDSFKGKKITVMGLGLLGRGIADVRFLVEAGAVLTVTDMKSEEELADALEQLSDLEGITYHLGGHRFEDFEEADVVLKAAGVPLDSPYVARAKEQGVAVKMDESWVAEIVGDAVTFVGVTGTRGKSTLTQLLFHTLKEANASVHLGGNLPGAAMLPLLNELEEGDIVVMELSSWQLQGWDEAGISPQIAAFTNFMDDHLNYYDGDRNRYFADKAAIFTHQGEDGLLVISPSVESAIEQYYQGDIESAVVLAEGDDVPSEWQLPIPGAHARELVGLAVRVLEAMGLPEEVMRAGIESFKGVPGRLEYLGECKGARVFNDNNATTPAATKAGLLAVGGENNVVLIMGGTDKGLSFDELYPVIKKTCKQVVLLDESGSALIKDEIEKVVPLSVCESVQVCVKQGVDVLEEGGVLLFSPAFASFGKHFKNEYDRNDQFVEELRKYLD